MIMMMRIEKIENDYNKEKQEEGKYDADDDDDSMIVMRTMVL